MFDGLSVNISKYAILFLSQEELYRDSKKKLAYHLVLISCGLKFEILGLNPQKIAGSAVF